MKVILYMTMTVNGMIAPEGGRASFVSEESWKSLNKIAQKAGCVIYGRKSYDAEPIEGVLNVVLTHDKTMRSDKKEFVFMSGAPRKILEKLEKQGYQSVLVVGGGQTNAEFMKDDLINEIYLDVEPLILGKGTPLFNPEDFALKLELIEMRPLKGKTIQLHYRVKTK